MDSLLTNLADELLVQDIAAPSAVLGSLSDDELQAAYDHILEQFALELLIGAAKDSEWFDGKLVIDANHGSIHLLQAAFYAVKLELQRRKFGMALTMLKRKQLELIAPAHSEQVVEFWRALLAMQTVQAKLDQERHRMSALHG